MYKEISRFPFLGSLRFMAAFLVVLHHGESIRGKYGMHSMSEYSIFNLGDFAVTFFFVLSGFLITYLLFKERQAKRTISIRNFYIRRMLRIWPLYFMLVGFGLFVLPWGLTLIGYDYQMPYTWCEALPYYLFFAPFMVNVIYGTSLLEPLWSIGVEELFYLGWAPAFKWIKCNILGLLIGVIIVKIAIGICASTYEWNGTWVKVFHMLKFEAMAIGALGALLIYHANKPIERLAIFSPTAQAVVFALIFGKMLAGNFLVENSAFFALIFGNYLVSGYLFQTLFCYTIINLSINSRSIFGSRENRTLERLGDISYGVYMYHMPLVFMVVLVAQNSLNTLAPWLSSIVFYSIVISITILVSFLSKRHIEDRFLALRSRFS